MTTSHPPRLELVWPNRDRFLFVPKDELGKSVWVAPDHSAAVGVRVTEFMGIVGEVDDTDPTGGSCTSIGADCRSVPILCVSCPPTS